VGTRRPKEHYDGRNAKKNTYFRNKLLNFSIFQNKISIMIGVIKQHYKEAYREYVSTLQRILDDGIR
jgi:hypothetical protein